MYWEAFATSCLKTLLQGTARLAFPEFAWWIYFPPFSSFLPQPIEKWLAPTLWLSAFSLAFFLLLFIRRGVTYRLRSLIGILSWVGWCIESHMPLCVAWSFACPLLDLPVFRQNGSYASSLRPSKERSILSNFLALPWVWLLSIRWGWSRRSHRVLQSSFSSEGSWHFQTVPHPGWFFISFPSGAH